MPQWLSQGGRDVWSSVHPYLPTLGVALAILVGGLLLAYILRAITFAALKRTQLDNRAARFLGVQGAGTNYRTERLVSKIVFWLTLAFVFVAFFNQLQITAVTAPVVGALSGITAAIPSLFKALIIGVIGFLLAKLARRLVVALVDRTGLSDRLARLSSEGRERRAAFRAAERTPQGVSRLASTLGDIAYWVVIAIAAVPVLEALRVGVLAEPLQAALSAIATYVPRIAAAVLLLAIGYVLGRLLRGLTSAVLHRVGLDRLMDRIGGQRVMRGQSLSGIVGAVVMAFVLLHFAISAVGRLNIPEISEPLGGFLASIYAYLPRLFVGGLVLAIGIVVARVAGNVCARLFAAMGFNTLMSHLGIRPATPSEREQELQNRGMWQARVQGQRVEAEGEDAFFTGERGVKGIKTPSDIGGVVVSVVVGIIFLRQALATMRLDSFSGMLDEFIGYLPQVLAAAIIVGAAMWAGNWAHRRIDEVVGMSQDRLFRASGTVAHVAIVTVGAMMAAQQLGVAPALVGTAFALLLGAICLAGALAFGLGGREVAADILKREYVRRRRQGGVAGPPSQSPAE